MLGSSPLVCHHFFMFAHPSGQPPVIPKYDDSLAVEYTQLAQKTWIEGDGNEAKAEDVEGWNAKQLSKLHLLQLHFQF